MGLQVRKEKSQPLCHAVIFTSNRGSSLVKGLVLVAFEWEAGSLLESKVMQDRINMANSVFKPNVFETKSSFSLKDNP